VSQPDPASPGILRQFLGDAFRILKDDTLRRHPLQSLRLALRRHPIILQTDFVDVPVSIVVDSLFESAVRVRSASAEPELVDYIRGLSDGSVFFDIGANVGTYSIFAAKLHPALQVFAFEPNILSAAKLVRNVALNNAPVQIVPLALFRDDKYSVLDIPSSEIGTASCQFDDMTHRRPTGNNIQQGIFGMRLDSLIAEWQFPIPNYIKIDVDGLEGALLQGMADTLRQPALRSVFIEVTSDNHAELEHVLKDAGFALNKEYPRDSVTYNCLFSRMK
jgi:FkbM family methyltransferase